MKTRTVIPAVGYSALTPLNGDNLEEIIGVYKCPIIAWVIEVLDGQYESSDPLVMCPIAVTLDGNESGELAILHEATGVITLQDDRQFDTATAEAELIAHWMDWRKRLREAKSKREAEKAGSAK